MGLSEESSFHQLHAGTLSRERVGSISRSTHGYTGSLSGIPARTCVSDDSRYAGRGLIAGAAACCMDSMLDGRRSQRRHRQFQLR